MGRCCTAPMWFRGVWGPFSKRGPFCFTGDYFASRGLFCFTGTILLHGDYFASRGLFCFMGRSVILGTLGSYPGLFDSHYWTALQSGGTFSHFMATSCTYYTDTATLQLALSQALLSRALGGPVQTRQIIGNGN